MRLKGIKRDFDTVIFDLDGTLVDSMWMWRDIDVEYLARFGLKYNERIYRDIEGMSVEECAEYFRDVMHIPRTVEEMRADWIEMSFYKYRDEVPLKPHTREFLELLKAAGVRLGIATSNAMEMVTACLESNHVTEYFDAVVTCSEVERGKPAPDVYLYTARKLGADPSRCIVFEDVPAGIQAGAAAGMETVAVYDDNSAELTEEKRAAADLYINDYSELLMDVSWSVEPDGGAGEGACRAGAGKRADGGVDSVEPDKEAGGVAGSADSSAADGGMSGTVMPEGTVCTGL